MSATPQSPPSPRKHHQFQGPCYLKMLVEDALAGSIIGRNGSVISQIEQQTGAYMKLSPSGSYFPGTNNRIVAMSGQQEQINQAMLVILDKINESANSSVPSSGGKITCKIVVPKSAVSAIIGKGGAQIKQLQETTAAKIQISNREEGLNERVVHITGTLESLQNACLTIATSIQADQNLQDHMYLSYVPPNIFAATAAAGMPNPSFQYNAPFAPAGYNSPYPHGPPAAAAAAAAQQDATLLQSHCWISLHIPDNCVGFVIGKNGTHVNEILQASGAKVQLSHKNDLVPGEGVDAGTNNRKVTITGTVHGVHLAHLMLLRRLAEAQQHLNKQEARLDPTATPLSPVQGQTPPVGMLGGRAGAFQYPGMNYPYPNTYFQP
eukprot:Platyproteum_vivax@DN14441_c0_g1_i1.p1